MALFGNDYDREFGYRGGMHDRERENRGWFGGGRETSRPGGWNEGWGGSQGRGGGGWNRDRMHRDEPMDRGYSAGGRGYGRDYGRQGGARYDRDWVGRGVYDGEYKSRHQTDTGDPFGDRQSGTPVRMIRGEFEARYDRGYHGAESRYDREFRGEGVYDRGYRGVDRTRYDRGYMGREPGINNEPYYGGGMNRPERGYRGYGHERDWF